jgi:hypothetical protein
MSASESSRTVTARLATLESGLNHLASRSKAVQDILRLRKISKQILESILICLENLHPDLYDLSNVEKDPLLLDVSSQLAIILASAPSYHSTASRLTSIHDVPLPRAESSAALVALQPRVGKMELLQESQARQMSDLRSRSAAVLERWYEIGVLGGGDCWDEWEGRIGRVERTLKRHEAALKREQDIT